MFIASMAIAIVLSTGVAAAGVDLLPRRLEWLRVVDAAACLPVGAGPELAPGLGVAPLALAASAVGAAASGAAAAADPAAVVSAGADVGALPAVGVGAPPMEIAACASGESVAPDDTFATASATLAPLPSGLALVFALVCASGLPLVLTDTSLAGAFARWDHSIPD